MPVAVVGSGIYLPSYILTNEEVCRRLAAHGITHTHGGQEITPEFIDKVVGIQERREADPDENTSDLAVKSVLNALEDAQKRGHDIGPQDLDIIICGSSTHERHYPQTAALTQAKIGARRGILAYDVSYACSSGVVAAIETINHLELNRNFRYGVAIGAETILSTANWSNINANLWGDGAACIIFERQPQPSLIKKIWHIILRTKYHGLLSYEICTDGYESKLTESRGMGTKKEARSGICWQETTDIYLDGKGVHKFAIRALVNVIQGVMDKAGLTPLDICVVDAHQANSQYIDNASKRLGIPMDKFRITLESTGNTSAASSLIAFNYDWQEGKIGPGDIAIVAAVGGGMGSAAFAFRL